MVLGDQGTYFSTDGNQIVDVNEASCSELWSWQPNSGTAEIIAATAGGGVAVKNIVGNQEDVVRLDRAAIPPTTHWGTAGGSAGYGVLSNSTYFANGVWFGTTGDPVIAGLEGDPEVDAPQVYSDHGGTPQKQSSADPGLQLVGVSDCTVPDPATSGEAIYYRYVNYKLVDNKNNAPSQNFTVYEQLSPNKQAATCKDTKGNYTGMSPCGPADGTNIKYNSFEDTLSLQLSAAPKGGLQNNQSFLYGLPGQRLWNVKTIERYGLGPNGSTYTQAPVPNVSSNDLLLRSLAEPLIDGFGYPYIGPANGPGKNCKGQPPFPVK